MRNLKLHVQIYATFKMVIRMSTRRNALTRTVIALTVVAAMSSPSFANDDSTAAIKGCVATGIATSFTIWAGAILASPFTGGLSLFAPLISDKVIIGGVIGCAAGAAGGVAAEEIVGQ